MHFYALFHFVTKKVGDNGLECGSLPISCYIVRKITTRSVPHSYARHRSPCTPGNKAQIKHVATY